MSLTEIQKNIFRLIFLVLFLFICSGSSANAQDEFDTSDGQVTYEGIIYTLGSPQFGGYCGYSYSPAGSKRVFVVGGKVYVGCRVDSYSGNWFCSIYNLLSTKPIPIDSDGDGLDDEYDPCPEIAEVNPLTVVTGKNKCNGEWYVYGVAGDCGEAETYHNPLYSESELAVKIKEAKDSGCYEHEEKSISVADYQAWWDNANDSAEASQGPVSGSIPSNVVPDDLVVDLSGQSSNSTSSNVSVPSATQSNDTNTQEILSELDRLRQSIHNDLEKQREEIVDNLDDVNSRILSMSNSLQNKLTGVSNSLSDIENAISGAGDQAHTDAENIANALNNLATSMNGTGSGSSGSENGTGSGGTGEDNGTGSGEVNGTGTGNGTSEYGTPPVAKYFIPEEKNRPVYYNATIEGEREQAAKNDLLNSWTRLKQRVETFLNLSLTGTGSLPVWDWEILGNNVKIDFRKFEEIFKMIGLAILFIAAIRAFFIVFD